MRLPSQWFLAVEPIDLRCGMDRLLVWVQRSGGRDQRLEQIALGAENPNLSDIDFDPLRKRAEMVAA